MAFSTSELDFLLSGDVRQVYQIAQGLALQKSSMLSDLSLLREHGEDRARAVVELVTAQRRLERKGLPQHWITDSDAAQQATPAAVAQWRASYLYASGVRTIADVTCSIGTEVAACTSAGIRAYGADMDPLRVRMASANVDSSILVADATVPVFNSSVDAVIADPARRNSSGRITKFEDLHPPLPELMEAYSDVPLIVKCAPGIDYSVLGQWARQVDIVSVAGEVKEACIYSQSLSDVCGSSSVSCENVGGIHDGVYRRAVVIDVQGGVTTWHSDMDWEEDDSVASGKEGKYIVDPDGAIVRAGLVRHYAYAHGLWQLDPKIAYLTGDRIPRGLRGFEILEKVSMKKLKGALAARKIGQLEVLVRGVDIDPDILRKKMKLQRGGEAATVVITRISQSAVAFICRACPPQWG